jgi:CheY-like chemotaxis protein
LETGRETLPYKILVVEDTFDTRALVMAMLQMEGYSVYEAADGKEGLEQARDVRPDMIVTDIRMPQMSGIEMVEQLRKEEIFEGLQFWC